MPPGIPPRSNLLLQGVVRSFLPLYILDLLERPRHGLEVADRIARATGGAWKPSAGTLYPTLQRMERDGLLAGEWQRSSGAPRRVYTLTEGGREEREAIRRGLLDELRLVKTMVDMHLVALEKGPVITDDADGRRREP